MKVLVVVDKRPIRRYLVKLSTANLIEEVKDLINTKHLEQAITTVFSKGNFEREVDQKEIYGLNADLILSERSAYWDLT